MNIAVFLGAVLPDEYGFVEQVMKVGALIGQKGHILIYGGSFKGTMGVLAKAAKDNGASLIGVIPVYWNDLVDERNDKTEFVESMGKRKERMAELSDLFIICPGGLGTLEEASDVISWKRLGLTNGKTVFLDYRGFYTPLHNQIESMIRSGYLDQSAYDNILFVNEADELETLL